jgi:ubiquinone/menaquinone biosynthesis C-methylase UbiE
MIVLDLGCGSGQPWTTFENAGDRIIGIDISLERLSRAAAKYPNRIFFLAAGEFIPLGSQSVDRVVANVALPYMDIPRTLQESARVLRPGGTFKASLHPWKFTVHEFWHVAFPRPGAMLRRLRVMGNGLKFHLTGRSCAESFQTERGMKKALLRAGFEEVEFSKRPDGRWFAAARRKDEKIADGRKPQPGKSGVAIR